MSTRTSSVSVTLFQQVHSSVQQLWVSVIGAEDASNLSGLYESAWDVKTKLPTQLSENGLGDTSDSDLRNAVQAWCESRGIGASVAAVRGRQIATFQPSKHSPVSWQRFLMQLRGAELLIRCEGGPRRICRVGAGAGVCVSAMASGMCSLRILIKET